MDTESKSAMNHDLKDLLKAFNSYCRLLEKCDFEKDESRELLDDMKKSFSSFILSFNKYIG